MPTRSLRLALALAAFASLPAAAPASPNPNAEVVLLRQSCAGLGDDCFTSTSALTGWVWNVRHPSASSPLLVDAGPGSFDEFDCPQGTSGPNGWVTVRGAGREHTVISGYLGVLAIGCEQLEFLNVGIEGALAGVLWLGGGSAVWTGSNVRVSALSDPIAAWAAVCNGTTTSRHDFFGTRLVAEDVGDVTTGRAFWGACVDARFYGSDISLSFAAGTSAQSGSVVTLREASHLELLGGSVRARLPQPGDVGELVGVDANPQAFQPTGTARFEMHGGIVSILTAEGASQDVDTVAIRARAGSVIDTTGTAFALMPSGTGVARRIDLVPGGTPAPVVASPFLWQYGADEPVAGLQSLDAADLFVETDCDASGACEGSGNEPHPMVYSSTCQAAPNGKPWFDLVTGVCRVASP